MVVDLVLYGEDVFFVDVEGDCGFFVVGDGDEMVVKFFFGVVLG